MDVFLIAQIIGLIGYSIYISGPYFGHKQNVLKMDMLACIVLMGQWAILAQPLLVISNIIGVLSNLVALSNFGETKKRKLLQWFYPLIFLGFAPFWNGQLIDILALSAALCMVSARAAGNVAALRIWAMVGGVFLMIAGGLALSAPAVVFNLVFVGGHLQKLCNLGILRRNPRVELA